MDENPGSTGNVDTTGREARHHQTEGTTMNTIQISELASEDLDQIDANTYRTFDGITITAVQNGVGFDIDNLPVRTAPEHLAATLEIIRHYAA